MTREQARILESGPALAAVNPRRGPRARPQVRAGVHTGEVERRESNALAGMAAHIGARASDNARADEVLVTGTVRDLTLGSGLTFVDRGEHELKGVPDRWHLYALLR